MSDQDYGVLLQDANDVLPMGLAGTPWEIIYNALRDVLKSGVGASDSDFMRKACALYFLARGDLDAVTDRGVLNGIAAALAIPYWVENFDDPKQASAVLYNWINYLPTRANLTALALASGMRAFKLREIYTSTEYGLSHTFGFDLGEGYETSFFAGPNAEPGLATAQRICGALTHFFLRIKDAPTVITDITYPSAAPSGWQYFFRADQSEIRILQGYNFDLYDADGNLAMLPDEYAVVEPVAVRDTYGTNTAISGSTHLITLDDGQMRISWGQSPVNAYSLFANVSINIPGMLQTWPSLSHVDVNLPPNAIPGAPLFDGMDDRIFGPGWEIFAAYDSNLNRIDINDLYLAGGSDLYDPVYLRARRYLTVCSVWLSYTPPPPPPIPEDTSFIIVNETTGNIEHYISDDGMVFSQVGHIEMPDSEMITVYETGVQTESFYFTTNGRNETANTTLPVDSSIPLYWADGSRVDDSEGWASEYNGSPVLALTKADMNVLAALQNDKVISVDHSGTDCLDFYGAGSTQEITIDANFGDAVSIPNGYTVQSVKSTTAYSFPTSITAIDSWNFTIKYGGKDVYSDDIIASDVCVNSLPCLYIFQYTTTSRGWRLSTTRAKYDSNITAITDVSVNSGSNDFVVMTCTAQSSAHAQDIVSHASAYPGYFEYYGSDGNIVSYFFNVPQTLWKFENGSFSWLGDTSSTSDLAYWYNSKAVRIKCVKSVSQSRSAWSALVEKIFTLSFANTQLPGITITLPASETGTSGTTVTLPTMFGEYESGGKTWTPSAWDIGAFGSTYTITSDTVAHLIFEEVPSELTAYFTNQGAAGTEDTFIQNGVTYTLYDSLGATIPYDPSKIYTKILLYKFDGTEMSPDGVTALDSDQGWCDTILKVRPNGNKYVYKLTYTVS